MSNFKLTKLKYETSEIDGVYRIKVDIPFDVKFVCVHIFEVDDKLVMIDAGFNTLPWRRLFFKALNELNLKIEDIDYCFVSHEHLDHCGLLKYFKRKNPDLKILMHKTTDESLRFGSNSNYFGRMERNAIKIAKEIESYGMGEKEITRLMKSFLVWPKIVRYEAPNRLLKDDDEISFTSNKLKIIWTPGHSLGHICVFDIKNKHLFSGDHILSHITPHIGVYHISTLINEELSYPNILDLYLNSLDKIDKLNPKIIYPGHQELITNPHERILEIKKHHQNRFKEICRSIESKPLTPFEISQIHFGTDLDDMNKYLALNEILSHLIYLEHQEKVKKFEKDGLFYFSTI